MYDDPIIGKAVLERDERIAALERRCGQLEELLLAHHEHVHTVGTKCATALEHQLRLIKDHDSRLDALRGLWVWLIGALAERGIDLKQSLDAFVASGPCQCNKCQAARAASAGSDKQRAASGPEKLSGILQQLFAADARQHPGAEAFHLTGDDALQFAAVYVERGVQAAVEWLGEYQLRKLAEGGPQS